MDDQKTITMKPFTRIRIIANNDCTVLDFLADLLDREPIHSLQRFINYSNQETNYIFHLSEMDEMAILILYKAPFGINKNDNRLIIFAWNDLRGLCTYFQLWLDVISEKDDRRLYDALKDITCLLTYQLALEHDKNAQTNFMG
jgi:hypothetical protein